MKTKDEILETAKRIAEANADHLGDGSFQPAIHFDIEDRTRVVFFPRIEDAETRQQVYWSTQVIASGIDQLDSITFALDTYHSTHKHKKDGTEWGVGGMQYAVDNQTEDAELVYDAFSLHIMHANGDAAMATIPYKKVDGKAVFDWQEAMVLVHGENAERVGGFFVEMMQKAFTQPKFIKEMAKHFGTPDVFGLTEDEARMHSMAVAVKMVMHHTQMNCLVPCYSPEEQALVKESFSGGPFSEGLRSFDQDQVAEIVTLEEAFKQPSFERDLGLTNQGDLDKEE